MKYASITLLLFLLTTNLFAEVINIPDDFETIQAGINEAEDGDTVLVSPGEYVENINFDGKAIAVIGNPDDPGEVVIDGDANGSSVVVFRNEEDENSTLSGFTIRNGDTDYGGGIYCNGAAPQLLNLIIVRNEASHNGGGVYCTRNSEPIIRECIIQNNNATEGGGLSCYSGCNVSVFYSIISDNSASDDAGGIQDSGSDLSVYNSSVINNEAGDVGGAITCTGFFGSLLHLENCLVLDNISENGAAIYNNGSGEIYVVNSIVRGNQTDDFEGLSDRDSVLYSNVEGGFRGEGNIDEDPRFVDPENGDYHLLEDSPCIDAGDPNSSVDPDGTRADIGIYPFFQGSLVVEGYVFDAEDEPLIGAVISTSYDGTAMSDSIGFYQFSPARPFPFTVTASRENFIDSTTNEIQLEFMILLRSYSGCFIHG